MTPEEMEVEINKLQAGIADNQRQLQILRDIAKKTQQQPKLERWKPEEGQDYWVLYSDGSIADEAWHDQDEDKDYYNNFNCFQTKEEAKKEALRTRARRKLAWLARQLSEKRYTVNVAVWYILYDGEKFEVTRWEEYQDKFVGAVYFYTKQDGEYALSQMTAEELEALGSNT